MKNKILAILLAMVMLVGMLPMSAYATETEHTHVWKTEWSHSDSYHWHDCTAEGCDLNPVTGVDKDGYARHAFDITKVNHSNIDNTGYGYHYGTCEICGHNNSKLILTATCHFDDTYHWCECSCGVIGWGYDVGKAEHRFDDDTDTTCDDCGYVRTVGGGTTVDGIITLTPDDLVEGASGEGWRFNGGELTISPDYTLNFEGNCNFEVKNEGTISGGSFGGNVHSWGTISGGTFSSQVTNDGTITGGTFSGTVVNNTVDAVISNGIFNGDVHNFGIITGGTFSGKLENHWDQSISGITIELSNALIEGGESYGWSLNYDRLFLNSGITFYWKDGEECAYIVTNEGNITGGTFKNTVAVNPSGEFANGIINAGVICHGKISGGSIYGGVENHGTISEGFFAEYVNNYYGVITGGTFSGKLINKGTISGITIELSNALIEGGESYGWSLDEDNNLILNSDITFYWKAGEECAYHVRNRGTISGGSFGGNVYSWGTISGGTFSSRVDNEGTISGGTFFGKVDNIGTIEGGVFTGVLQGSGIVTGTVDLSELAALDIKYGLRFGKDVKLPKAVMKGNLTYTGCDASTQITLEYYADGVYTSTHTVSGSNYSFAVERYKRADPEADLSTLKEINHEVKAVSVAGYDITIDNPVWDRFHVTVTHTAEYIYVSNGDGTHSRTCTDATHTHDDKTESCSGGIATCTEKAVCTVCGQPYGNTLGHDFSGPAVDVGLDGTHRCYCQREGCDDYGVENHDWVWTDCTSPGKCECGAEGPKQGHKPSARTYLDDEKHHTYCVREGCGVTIRTDPHVGGTATCTEKAVCAYCAQPYGNTLGHDWGNWISNGDGTHTRTCAKDANHTETETCSGGIATCTEKAVCETCGTAYGEANPDAHDWGNWISNSDGTHTRTCANDANHTETENCSGGIATCTEKAVCTVCAVAYGDTLPHTFGTEWKSDGTNHWHECTCGAKSEEAAHSGGTATCKDKAVCSVCTATYGELANHTYKDGKCTVCEAADPNYVPETDSPQTGDNSHMALWLALLFISGGAVIIMIYVSRIRNTAK